MIDGLTRDARGYFLDGRPVPRVTTILAPVVEPLLDRIRAIARAQKLPDPIEAARIRGTAVHRLIADEVEHDDYGAPDCYRPYLRAWARFMSESGFVIAERERMVYHPTLDYAGTLDAVGDLRGDLAIVDWKTTSTLAPHVGLQTIGYLDAYNAEALAREEQLATHRYAVRLDESGAYTLRRYDARDDRPAFLGLLNLHNWKVNHKA